MMSADGAPAAFVLRLLTACGLGVFCSSAAIAADGMPDMEFLEYLGSWEASDEEWLLVEEVVLRNENMSEGERDDPGPDAGKSAETVDEQSDER